MCTISLPSWYYLLIILLPYSMKLQETGASNRWYLMAKVRNAIKMEEWHTMKRYNRGIYCNLWEEEAGVLMERFKKELTSGWFVVKHMGLGWGNTGVGWGEHYRQKKVQQPGGEHAFDIFWEQKAPFIARVGMTEGKGSQTLSWWSSHGPDHEERCKRCNVF